MTDVERPDGPPTPSQVLAELLPAIRSRRGITASAFADIAKGVGFKFDRATISKIENSLRGVSLDEAVGIAAVLGVAPVHLFLPRQDDQMVQITPAMAVGTEAARRWFRGLEPLPGGNDKVYRTETPESEWEASSERLSEAEDAERRARRRYRVAKERLDLLFGQMSELENRDTWEARGRGVKVDSGAIQRERNQMNRWIDVALDVVAEAKVDWEEARDELRRVRAEEARHVIE